MPQFVTEELYEAHKQQVWQLTNATQRWEPGGCCRGLSDVEIAARLGLETWQVTEIRCLAETEMIPLADYQEAEDVKEARLGRLGKARRRRT